MNATLLLQLASLVVCLFLWGAIYGQRRDAAVNRAFRMFMFVCAGWIFIEVIHYSPLSRGHELTLQRLLSIFWISCGFWFLNFAYRVLRRPNDAVFYLLFALTLLGVLLDLFTDLGTRGTVRHPWGVSIVRGPIGVPVLTVLPSLCSLLGLGLIERARRHERDAALRRPFTLILIGGVITLASVWTVNVLIPDILGYRSAPRLGSAALVVFCFFIYRATLRHGFMRIDVEQVVSDLFEDTRDGIVLLDPEGVVKRLNRSARALFSPHRAAEPELALLRRFIDIEDYRNRVVALFEGDAARQLSISQTTLVHGRDVLGRILIIHDVTKQQQAKQLLERSRDDAEREVRQRLAELEQAQKVAVIGTLAGGIAHDFNNLLGVALGFASLTHGDLPKGHPAREKLEATLQAARAAQALVEQILAFSRRGKSERVPLPVATVVGDMVGLLEVSLPASIDIRSAIHDADVQILADPQQLLQVLLNVCTNAYEAIGDREGRLSIQVQRVDVDNTFARSHAPVEPGSCVRITVSDNGPGMSADVLEHLFDPFFTTKGDAHGTGLGLSTAQHIVKDHGGAITVRSSEGQGATFEVYLPALPTPSTP
ncbi:MAG: ATP-binding protein [bacterium]